MSKPDLLLSERLQDAPHGDDASLAACLRLLESRNEHFSAFYRDIVGGGERGTGDAEVPSGASSLGECIGALMQVCADRMGRFDALTRLAGDREDAIRELEAETKRLRQMLDERDRELATLRSSRSWKITQPLRAVNRVLAGRSNHEGKS